jgi:ceramide glucosyltransferase
MYLSTYHAKFYVAINTVLIAPASVGKSTMFRAIDLDSLTDGQGIDYFSYNICEDHLIGDLLWKQKVPAEKAGTKLGKHAVCFGDLAIQPVADVSVGEYWNKRVRWLRVRKFTVTLATLVEPGTESFSCSLYGAFAFTTIPVFHSRFGIPPTWPAFFAFWLLSITIWCAMDWALYRKLQSGASIWISHMSRVPDFVKPIKDGKRRPFHEWLFAWLGREALAVPLWLWAIYGGTTVEWRGKKFWVGMDMRVHEIADDVRTPEMNGFEAVANGKYRKD